MAKKLTDKEKAARAKEQARHLAAREKAAAAKKRERAAAAKAADKVKAQKAHERAVVAKAKAKAKAEAAKVKAKTQAAKAKERAERQKAAAKAKAAKAKAKEQKIAAKAKANGWSSETSFSKSEQRVLDLIPVKGRISTTDLIEKFYADAERRPFNARVIMSGRLRTIMHKQKFMKPDVVVKSTERAGPHAMEFWKEQRA